MIYQINTYPRDSTVNEAVATVAAVVVVVFVVLSPWNLEQNLLRRRLHEDVGDQASYRAGS